MARELRPVTGMMCRKCGQDQLTAADLPYHGIKRCTRVAHREKICPTCGMDFVDVKHGTRNIADFSKPNEDGSYPRKNKEVFIKKVWSAAKIYAHKIEHQRAGDRR